jgi:hypothetical protein
MDRYSDMMYLGAAALSVIGSIFAAIYTNLTKVAPEQASELATAILDIGERIEHANSLDAIDTLQDELEAILRGTVMGLRDGSISIDGLDTFKLGYEFVRDEIGMRRDYLKRHGGDHTAQDDNVAVVKIGIDHLAHAVDWSSKTLTAEASKSYLAATRDIRSPFRTRIDWLERLDLASTEVRDTIAEVAKRAISVDLTLIAYDVKFAAPDGGRYASDPFVRIAGALSGVDDLPRQHRHPRLDCGGLSTLECRLSKDAGPGADDARRRRAADDGNRSDQPVDHPGRRPAPGIRVAGGCGPFASRAIEYDWRERGAGVGARTMWA